MEIKRAFSGIVVFLAFSCLPACDPVTRAQWAQFGKNLAVNCGAAAIQAGVNTGLQLLRDRASGNSDTSYYKTVGTELATKIGVDAAWCAVDQATKTWAGAGGLPASPDDEKPLLLASWLQDHPKDWLKKPDPELQGKSDP